MSNSSRRVCLLGSNSGRNAGDLALLETVVRQVSSRRPGTVFEIPTTRPDFIGKHFAGLPVVPLSVMPWDLSLRLLGVPVLRSISRCDLSLILDGIIFDHRLWNPAFNFLVTLAPLAVWSRRLGRTMACCEVGVGPLRTAAGRRFARTVADACRVVLVREEGSARLLREIGVSAPVEVYADAAFLQEAAPPERVDALIAGLGLGGRPLIGFNLTRYGGEWLGKGTHFDKQAFQARTAAVVDGFSARTGAAVVLTGTQHMDRPYLEEVLALVKRKDDARLVSNVELTPAEMAGLMGRMEMFVGMRLHSLILASSALTPVVGLTYAPKVGSLFELLGRPELALDLRSLEADALLETLAAFWERRVEERARHATTVGRLKTLAAAGFDRLVETCL